MSLVETPSGIRTERRTVSLAHSLARSPGMTVSAQPKAASGAPAPKPAAKITSEDARTLYRDMFLGREFEEMCAQMYYRGKMFGFVHLYSGQEAVSTGKRPQCSSALKFSICSSLPKK